ncbi:MAG: ATP-binding cassette domain-containing protein [Lentisphaeria bacterium]|nr:ATP-binding cassette domain-containing protein [Lentisphaeria bacterium]
MAYGDTVIQHSLSFAIRRGAVFVIMGGSGCGKSTLLRHLIGLKEPAEGRVWLAGFDFWTAPVQRREALMKRCGVLYQSGALWSSMTLAENVGLPLREFTRLSAAEIEEVVSLKLALVGLAGFEEYYPSELSGGMRKRAGLARAMALDPEILFFDEPSAGLDPISARRLDELILELRAGLGTTVVVVTHELASIFTIADDAVLLDGEARTMIARGNPRELLRTAKDSRVIQFLTRGGGEAPGSGRSAAGSGTESRP